MIDISQTNVLALNEVTTESDEILRNVRVLLSTVQGQVALNRNMGMNPDILDAPMPDAQSFYVVEAIQQLNQYEPRARIEDVTFTGDMNGKLIPRVVIELVGNIA